MLIDRMLRRASCLLAAGTAYVVACTSLEGLSGDAGAEAGDAIAPQEMGGADVGADADAAVDVVVDSGPGDGAIDPCAEIDAAAFLDAGDAGLSWTLPSTALTVCEDGGPPRDLGGDPQNCGACGRSCRQGAGCTSGYCDPVGVVSLIYKPLLYGMDNGSFYFTDSAQIFGAPSGGAAQVVLNSSGGFLVGRVTSNVIAAYSAALSGIALLNVATAMVDPVPNSSGVQMLALTSTHVYWTNRLDRRVYRGPLAGGTTEIVLGPSSSPPLVPFTIVSDQRRVFWAEWDENALGGGTAIGMYDPDAGATRQAFPGMQLRTMASDQDYLYLLDATTGGVYRTPKRSLSTIVPIAVLPMERPAAWTVATAVDAAHIYVVTLWGGGSDSSLIAIPKCGGRPLEIVRDGVNGGLVLDDAYVYYGGAYESSGILRVAK
jgi:hypothetical protein